MAIDLPGFGEAPEPEADMTMAQMSALLIDFVTAENLARPVLVGHSMGTQVVAEAAAQRPELFPELILVAPTVNRLERSIKLQGWRMMQDLFGESPRVISVGAQNYAKTGPRWFVKKLRNMMIHTIEDILPQIQAHTLVIRGSRDRICPRSWVEEVTALIPDATKMKRSWTLWCTPKRKSMGSAELLRRFETAADAIRRASGGLKLQLMR